MEYVLPAAKFVVLQNANHADLFGSTKFTTQVNSALANHFA
jgi:hypothetical protein